ncbi:hypothetical protein NPIL_142611 [Nephila pilipes]|uniref:Uncharacterized protein n=1 Tax=Nephila pilipes TaxID=299642 RepID=A0A8X6U5M5_NEPPI|nr:hypothetical protein NPIL_142611 [Nephila pilipes]
MLRTSHPGAAMCVNWQRLSLRAHARAVDQTTSDVGEVEASEEGRNRLARGLRSNLEWNAHARGRSLLKHYFFELVFVSHSHLDHPILGGLKLFLPKQGEFTIVNR